MECGAIAEKCQHSLPFFFSHLAHKRIYSMFHLVWDTRKMLVNYRLFENIVFLPVELVSSSSRLAVAAWYETHVPALWWAAAFNKTLAKASWKRRSNKTENIWVNRKCSCFNGARSSNSDQTAANLWAKLLSCSIFFWVFFVHFCTVQHKLDC